jgi:hypothetical protein
MASVATIRLLRMSMMLFFNTVVSFRYDLAYMRL